MAKARLRLAVAAPRRRFDAARVNLPGVDRLVRDERPEEPMHCLRPAVLRETARSFVASFPGDTLYAVKCNPDPRVLRALWDGGVRHFDCASPAEVSLVRQLLPDADIHYMHPVKARGAIREAFAVHGVRDFALDSAAELHKLMTETGGGVDAAGRPELGLIVRLSVTAPGALHALTGKFGADADEAVALLRAARPLARRLGLSFHVGSQCMDPRAYVLAIERAGAVLRAAGVVVDVLDIGGGFPVAYPGITPLPLAVYMDEIGRAVEGLGAVRPAELWAEPGRALVAPGASIVVQVQHRRGNALYINDGIYGSLSDAGALGWNFPVRLVRSHGRAQPVPEAAFEFFGPTCDSLDHMKGPFLLPADVAEGDWIEIGQLGAYGATLRTGFNGFDRALMVEVGDRPLLETAGYRFGAA